MTEKWFSLVNVNVIFNIIFFDYVKEWSCLCDTSGGGGVYSRFLSYRGVHSRGGGGGFIQSITVIRTCFSFLDILCFSVSFGSYSDKIIRLSQSFIFQKMRYILKSTDKFLQYLLGTA